MSGFEPLACRLQEARLPPFGNFHDARAEGQDYKIRFAFTGTPFYGAYMTDIIKDCVMLKSGDLMRCLATHPHVVAESVERLRPVTPGDLVTEHAS